MHVSVSLTALASVLIVALLVGLGGRPVGALRRGAFRMCPPGGKTFKYAFSMTCDMKKRRKRSAIATRSSIVPIHPAIVDRPGKTAFVVLYEENLTMFFL